MDKNAINKSKKKKRHAKKPNDILRHGFSWGGNTPLWEEESEELVNELEELREQAQGTIKPF